MRLTREQIETLGWLVERDASERIGLEHHKGELVIAWRDAAGISCRMALTEEGKVVLPRRPRFRRRRGVQ